MRENEKERESASKRERERLIDTKRERVKITEDRERAYGSYRAPASFRSQRIHKIADIFLAGQQISGLIAAGGTHVSAFLPTAVVMSRKVCT